MTEDDLNKIRAWDRKCGDNELTMFGTTLDRRRLLEFVDELRAENRTLREAAKYRRVLDDGPDEPPVWP